MKYLPIIAAAWMLATAGLIAIDPMGAYVAHQRSSY